MEKIDKELLQQVAGLHEIPVGAYNIRKNGKSEGRKSTENIEITSKEEGGLEIRIKPGTKNESVHIPVIITETGVQEMVYNDFYVGENSDVLIVAGCGIHNSGDKTSKHDGLHRFFIGKNAHLRYVEKHYGEGEGTGERIMNPSTEVTIEENAVCEMEMVQIKGVNSSKRKTEARLGKNAKLTVTERLMTHGKQFVQSDMDIYLDGEGSSAQIISRSVGKDDSKQVFNPVAIGNNACRAHIQCDSIIMDNANIRSIPEIAANHRDAQIVHEAAIGRINGDQILKLQTLGLTPEKAEKVIIDGFLR